MLFSHLGRPSQAIFKVVLRGHPFFLQHVTAKRKRSCTRSPTAPWLKWAVKRLGTGMQVWITHHYNNAHAFAWANCEGISYLFCWQISILATQSRTNLNVLQSVSKTVPITGKEQMTVIQTGKENARRSRWEIHMYEDKRGINSWVHCVYFSQRETQKELTVSALPP